MRILHCCLSCFYVDNYSYQENMIPKFNKKKGNKVKIIASTEVFIDGKLEYIAPESYINEYGIEVVRLPYSKILPHFIMRKIRKYKNTLMEIKKFNPDVILFHGTCALDLLVLRKYKKINPKVKIYVDSHEDYNNSAKNIISRVFLHKLFYKRILQNSLKIIDKILYISVETKYFLEDLYKIPKEKLEFYPLGGIIKDKEDKQKIRMKIRKELKVSENQILFLHSGKLDKLKRTKDILNAFTKIKNSNFILIIIGSILEEQKEIYEIIKKDERIRFLGWKIGEELMEYLCASDIYLQPGSQSVTAQNAICCGLPVMLYPHLSYTEIYKKNVFWTKTEKDIEEVFIALEKDSNILKEMSKESYKIARKLLDYEKLADRIINL